MKNKVKLVLFSIALLLMSCGVEGGSSDTAIDPSTSPLDVTDISTATGTYKVKSMMFFGSDGSYFATNWLDHYMGSMTIDAEDDRVIYRVEFQDNQMGSYIGYGQSNLSALGSGENFDNAYIEIISNYEILFTYENLCSDDFCADVDIYIIKTSDYVNHITSSKYGLPKGFLLKNKKSSTGPIEKIIIGTGILYGS